MAKCFLCGKETNVEINIEVYNHNDVICGVCAVNHGIIVDPDVLAMIREAEGLPEEPKRYCSNCKFLARKLLSSDKRFCNRYSMCLAENEIDDSVCECHEFK